MAVVLNEEVSALGDFMLLALEILRLDFIVVVLVVLVVAIFLGFVVLDGLDAR